MHADVVVTGMGSVGPWGVGRDDLARALARGRPLSVAVDRTAGYHGSGGSNLAALVPAVDLARWLPPAQARRLSMPSRWAVAAARMALEEAGLASLAGRRTAVVLATAFGSVLFTERLVRQILEEGPESAQPFYFSECVANAPAAQVALAVGARGANVTVTEREAGPIAALAAAAAEVGEGRADVAIAGAADEMTPLLHAILDRFRATARGERTLSEAPRPFDRRRNGFLAGEGAAALVVERADAARARGAPGRVRLAAFARAFDPSATESDWGRGGDRLGAALSAAFRRAGVPPESVDLVVSGASGAVRGDALEAATLEAAWSGTAPPVVCPKGVVGEYGGGMLAAALLAADGAPFGALAAFEERDPSMTIVPNAGPVPYRPRRLLVSGLAAGGAGAWALLEAP